jgi:hypothetical protein
MGVPLPLTVKITSYIPLSNPLSSANIDLDKFGNFILNESSKIVQSNSAAPTFVKNLGDNFKRFQDFCENNTDLLKDKSKNNIFNNILIAMANVMKLTHNSVATGLVAKPSSILPTAALTSSGFNPVQISNLISSDMVKQAITITPQLSLFINAIGDFIFNSYPG